MVSLECSFMSDYEERKKEFYYKLKTRMVVLARPEVLSTYCGVISYNSTIPPIRVDSVRDFKEVVESFEFNLPVFFIENELFLRDRSFLDKGAVNFRSYKNKKTKERCYKINYNRDYSYADHLACEVRKYRSDSVVIALSHEFPRKHDNLDGYVSNSCFRSAFENDGEFLNSINSRRNSYVHFYN